MSSGSIIALVNPLTSDQAAARRAAELARTLGLDLRLAASVYRPELGRELFRSSAVLEQGREQRVAEVLEYLASLAAELGFKDAPIEACWDHPFDAAAVRLIARAPAAMVVVAPRRNDRLSSAEWRLIRAAEAPLLIARQSAWGDPPVISACLDPSHAHDKPAQLDRAIIAQAERLSRAFKTSYRVLHALGLPVREPGSPVTPDRYVADLEQSRGKQIRDMLPPGSRERVVVEFAHVPPLEGIEAFAKARGFDLCIIGSLSRTRVQELLIGGTLRELLPRLACDVLLVRPPAASEPPRGEGS